LENCPAVQKKCMRDAFFGGCVTMMCSTLEEEASHYEEIERFQKELHARVITRN